MLQGKGARQKLRGDLAANPPQRGAESAMETTVV
jgi:hypothetical protein